MGERAVFQQNRRACDALALPQSARKDYIGDAVARRLWR